MRTTLHGFDSTAVAAIDRELAEIATAEEVRILIAIESGSRAWGFPSPDSDYDCRFIYVRPAPAYLSIDPPRDVIERPPGPVLDVNGWDLVKALKLMLKGNAVVIEWLTSPHVYDGVAAFREEALALARRVVDPLAVGRHYLHLGERQLSAHIGADGRVTLKKLFYALRPAVALRWLGMHPGIPVAPMHFPTLVAETDLPGDVADLITHLVAEKARTRELGHGSVPTILASFLEEEFALARDRHTGPAAGPRNPGDPAMAAAADCLLRRWIGFAERVSPIVSAQS